ncbi:hypothetical protein Tco_0569708 [Tanacetum coccineum]
MACVAPRSHGGDAGGDPPDDRRPRILPHQCQGSRKHRESKHKLNLEPLDPFSGETNKFLKLVAEMKAIQEAITAGTIPPKTDREILAEVTQSTNRAHIAGVGRNLAGTSNLDSEWSQPDLGTSSSQFQIPNLYTPQVFPGSISTPGGPSSTSTAPSSTPLGFGNCYTPTFDPETSKSGEQDDNGSDDGNRE